VRVGNRLSCRKPSRFRRTCTMTTLPLQVHCDKSQLLPLSNVDYGSMMSTRFVYVVAAVKGSNVEYWAAATPSGVASSAVQQFLAPGWKSPIGILHPNRSQPLNCALEACASWHTKARSRSVTSDWPPQFAAVLKRLQRAGPMFLLSSSGFSTGALSVR
jgi:hypothetical protein